MLGKDGTGPLGKGSTAEQGRGRAGLGQAGSCICPKCNEKVPHTAGIPCSTTTCPKCGANMVRGC